MEKIVAVNHRNMEKAALFWSGGKDAAMALYVARQEARYDISYLVTTMNKKYQRVSMHGVREEMIDKQAASIGLPLIKMWMEDNGNNEAYEAALFATYDELKGLGITTIIFGDIFLEDLRAYRASILQKSGLQAYFPLWQPPSITLLQLGWSVGFRTVTCCINTTFLGEDFLGREVDQAFVESLPASIDPYGENGEYHTFCFAGPIFKTAIPYELGEKRLVSMSLSSADKELSSGILFIDLL